MGRALPQTRKQLASRIREALNESAMPDALVRFSVQWAGERSGAFVCLVRPFCRYPRSLYEQGVPVQFVAIRRPSPKSQDPRVKSTQFTAGVLAFLDAENVLLRERLFLGPEGYVAEGTTSNFFIVKDGTVLTPSVRSGILRGVTRGVVIELAKARQTKVAETFLTRHDFYSADECFLTNTSSEVMPVVLLDGRRIGSGKPGPVTQALARDFKHFVKREIS